MFLLIFFFKKESVGKDLFKKALFSESIRILKWGKVNKGIRLEKHMVGFLLRLKKKCVFILFFMKINLKPKMKIG